MKWIRGNFPKAHFSSGRMICMSRLEDEDESEKGENDEMYKFGFLCLLKQPMQCKIHGSICIYSS